MTSASLYLRGLASLPRLNAVAAARPMPHPHPKLIKLTPALPTAKQEGAVGWVRPSGLTGSSVMGKQAFVVPWLQYQPSLQGEPTSPLANGQQSPGLAERVRGHLSSHKQPTREGNIPVPITASLHPPRSRLRRRDLKGSGHLHKRDPWWSPGPPWGRTHFCPASQKRELRGH